MPFPPLRLKQAWNLGGLTVAQLAERTWKQIQKNEVMTRASAVSFYAMLASVPFLAILLTLAVQLLPDVTGLTGARGVGNLTAQELDETLKAMFPEEASGVIGEQIARIQKEPPFGLLSLGLLIALWTSSSLFVAIIDALDVIYGVTESRPFWKTRLVAMGMTLIQAVVLIAALLTIVVWPTVAGWLGLGATTFYLAQAVQVAVVWVMVLLSFALTYFVGPDAEQHWEWITPGSLFGSAVFLAFTYLFRLYVQNFTNYDKTYGSLGGVMILLFWFWISSLVLLAGAQINQVIEDASPLGKEYGQKQDATQDLDLSRVEAEPQAG